MVALRSFKNPVEETKFMSASLFYSEILDVTKSKHFSLNDFNRWDKQSLFS